VLFLHRPIVPRRVWLGIVYQGGIVRGANIISTAGAWICAVLLSFPALLAVHADAQVTSLIGIEGNTGRLYRYDRNTGKAQLIRILDFNQVGCNAGGTDHYFSGLVYESGSFYTTCTTSDFQHGRLVKFGYVPGDETSIRLHCGSTREILRFEYLAKFPGDPAHKVYGIGHSTNDPSGYIDVTSGDTWDGFCPTGGVGFPICGDAFSQYVLPTVGVTEMALDNAGVMHLAYGGTNASIPWPVTGSACAKADCANPPDSGGFAFDSQASKLFGVDTNGQLYLSKQLPINSSTYCTGRQGVVHYALSTDATPSAIGQVSSFAYMKGLVLAPDQFPGLPDDGADSCDYYLIKKALVCL
jgi:hypothetical protein